MRVTVCFNQTRIIVPCKGGVTVRELVNEACQRYKRAIGKQPGYWVNIIQLENAFDGGILDPNDYVYDVAEDRDQLTAIFEEDDSLITHDNNRSFLNDSGLPYHQPVLLHGTTNNYNRSYIDPGKASVIRHGLALEGKSYGMEIDVGDDMLKSNTSVTVRIPSDRLYTAPPSDEGYEQNSSYFGKRESGNGEETKTHKRSGSYMSANSSGSSNFTRGGVRQSTMGVLSADSWQDTYISKYSDMPSRENMLSQDRFHENYMNHDENLPSHDLRGQRQPPEGRKMSEDESLEIAQPKNNYLPSFYHDSQEIFVENDGTPWGLQVVSFVDGSRFGGLRVIDMETGSRAQKQNQVKVGDVIVEINDHILAQYDHETAQDIFRRAMKQRTMQLRIFPVEERERQNASVSKLDEDDPSLLNGTSLRSNTNQSSSTKLPLVAQNSLNTLANNSKKIGSVIEITLTRGEFGLGFSITTRDNPVGDPGPICIKNILPKGAAVQDGRLQAGDRLLKVNDIDMNGKTQEQAVSVLRGINSGERCALVVSRHVDMLPRKMKDDPLTDQLVNDQSNKEDHTFEIALNDTGSAGLGISLKGNQSKRTGKDLGIFIKSIFSGGAAYQDGRLQANDQLVSVNSQQLLGKSNQDAIRMLRSSMSTVGNVRGMIQMVVRRRKGGAFSTSSSRYSSEASSEYSDSLMPPDQRFKQATEISEPIHEHEPYASNNNRPKLIGSLKQRDSPYDNVPLQHGDFIESPNVSFDPFNRESIFRQSISEKRRPNPDENSKMKNDIALSPIAKQYKSASSENLLDNRTPQTPQKAKDPRLQKVSRGRVLNDSFRAALSTPNDIMPPTSGANTMDMLKEEEPVNRNNSQRSSQTTSSDEISQEKKKAKSYKLFGLFRVNKTNTKQRSASQERQLDDGIPERQIHRRDLDARKEVDYKKHQEESDRIRAKAREMREQQLQAEKLHLEALANTRSPSVPVTQMHKMSIAQNEISKPSGRKSVDPTVHETKIGYKWVKSKDSADTGGRRGRDPNRNGSSNKNPDNKNNKSNYNSLPRQRRFSNDDSSEKPQSPVTVGAKNTSINSNKSLYLSAKPTPTKFTSASNVDFYHQQKPVASPIRITQPNTHSPNTPSRKLYYNDFRNVSSDHKYNGGSPTLPDKHLPDRTGTQGVVFRTKKHNKTQSRRSVHVDGTLKQELKTEDPYKMLHSAALHNPGDATLTRRKKTKTMPRNLQRDGMSSSNDSSRTNSPNTIANDNRATFQKLMKTQYGKKLNLEKIQISKPYDL